MVKNILIGFYIMPTPNPFFFDDILIKRNDPNAWKSYTGRPNLPLQNSNLQPISELPDHNPPINTIIQENKDENKREVLEPQISDHNPSLSHKPSETKNKRSKL